MKILSAACSRPELAAEIRKRGADEIILACQNQTFSAMKEYAPEEICEFVSRGHALNLRVCIRMNRLYGQAEIHDAQALLKKMINAGVDGIYFADPGLFHEAVRLHAENRMIYEPETLMTSHEDASFWMKQKLQSVVISPLLTKEEIMSIAGKVPHTSLIVHGYELMSVSRRHLLQAYADASGKDVSFTGNRHLNIRENQREGHMPVYENAYGTMVYTDFVQTSFEEMNDFMSSGVERYLTEDAFLPEDAYLDAITACRHILDGEDIEKTGEEYRKRYGYLPLSNGYYGQKTIR